MIESVIHIHQLVSFASAWVCCLLPLFYTPGHEWLQNKMVGIERGTLTEKTTSTCRFLFLCLGQAYQFKPFCSHVLKALKMLYGQKEWSISWSGPSLQSVSCAFITNHGSWNFTDCHNPLWKNKRLQNHMKYPVVVSICLRKNWLLIIWSLKNLPNEK